MTTTLGATSLDRGVISLAEADSRRSFLGSIAKFLATSLAASVGLQVFRPAHALGTHYNCPDNGCPSFCGPSPQCPGSCCQTDGYCKASNCAPVPSHYCWYVRNCHMKYRCVDCNNGGNTCYCIKAVGGVYCTGYC